MSRVSAQKISLCTTIEKVVRSTGVYEKSLCYVKQKVTYAKAVTMCQNNGMKIYNVSSSPVATSKLSGFAKTVYKGAVASALYVEGQKTANCQTFNGAGASKYTPCTETRDFVCEFQASGS